MVRLTEKETGKGLSNGDHASIDNGFVNGLLPRVSDFFRGKNILITGASGFLGRTLIEKILREAPDVGSIFLLLRPKKGCAPRDRLQSVLNVRVFDRLRAKQPHVFDKLHIVAGDVMESGLGLSAEDVTMLRACVHVVYHIAASVRFDEPMRRAMLLNVRGTKEICELAKGMTHLQVLVHTSTAFCNMYEEVNQEVLSPPPGDWRVFVEAAETLDDLTLRILTEKILGEYANTYVFSKSLAEHIIDSYKHELPVTIIRPSMVLGAFSEPFGGWMDNLYGPIGMVLAGMAGAIHANWERPDHVIDYIPVDKLIKGMILLTIKRAVERGGDDLLIANGALNGKILWLSTEGDKFFRTFHEDFPINSLYKPFMIHVQSDTLFYILFMLMDISISLFYEIGLRLAGHKRGTLVIHRKLWVALKVIKPFIDRNFKFPNEKFKSLEEWAALEDKLAFELSLDNIQIIPYRMRHAMQLRLHVMKQLKSPSTSKLLIMEFVHYAVIFFLLWMGWKLQLPSLATQCLFSVGRFILMI